MRAQSVKCAASEDSVGIVVGPGGMIELVFAVACEQTKQIGLDTACENDPAMSDFFPGIITGDGGRFDDGDAIVTAGTEGANPDVEVGIGLNERGSYISRF